MIKFSVNKSDDRVATVLRFNEPSPNRLYSDGIEAVIENLEAPWLIADMTHVNFINSQCLGDLIQIGTNLRSDDGALVLVNCSSNVREVLEPLPYKQRSAPQSCPFFMADNLAEANLWFEFVRLNQINEQMATGDVTENFPSAISAELEIYVFADEPTAIASLEQMAKSEGGSTESRMPLPKDSIELGVDDIGCITVIQPDHKQIMDTKIRIGQKYAQFVLEYERRWLVINLSKLQPFGHPFHDDLLSLIRIVNERTGLIALCGVSPSYSDLLSTYPISIHFPNGVE